MIIRPISDLHNNFPEIEHQVNEMNEPVYLTENGYSRMVLVSIDHYSQLTENIESKLDEADKQSVEFYERYTLDQVVIRVKERINKG